MFTDEPAVVAMGAGDEEQNLASIFHAAQPGLDRVGTTLQVLARIPLHTWEVCPCIICGETTVVKTSVNNVNKSDAATISHSDFHNLTHLDRDSSNKATIVIYYGNS